MTPELTRRSGFALFVASAAAAGVGLLAAPAFDPMAMLRPRLGLWLPGTLLAGAAMLGSRAALRQLARRLHPVWCAAPLRAARWLAWGLGLVLWLLTACTGAVPDGRALLWLALSPLWVAAAGLWGGGCPDGSGGDGGSSLPERLPHRGHRLGPMDQVNVRAGTDVLLPCAGQQRTRRREDDVVAMAVDAQEHLAA